MKRIVLVLALLSAAAAAQEQRQMEVNVGGPGPRREAPAARKVTPEQVKRGQQWMQAAEAQAKGLEGGMRAYALLQIGKSYAASDKKHALELLEDALSASRAIEDSPHTSPRMQTRTR